MLFEFQTSERCLYRLKLRECVPVVPKFTAGGDSLIRAITTSCTDTNEVFRIVHAVSNQTRIRKPERNMRNSLWALCIIHFCQNTHPNKDIQEENYNETSKQNKSASFTCDMHKIPFRTMQAVLYILHRMENIMNQTISTSFKSTN